MRIALDASYSVDAHPSGIAVYSRELLQGLARAYPEDGFVHCYRPKQFKQAPPPQLENATRRPLLGWLPTFRADLFHALNQRADRKMRQRVVSTFHDLFVMTHEYSSSEFRARFTEQARRAAAHSDFIIAVSRFTADQVSKLLGFDRSRIRVIPHGVHLPPNAAKDTRCKMVLFTGALQIRKNIARLVEAFESLPRDWTLVLAGSPGGYRAQEILERIERSESKDRIHVTGYVARAELERLYSQASIFAFPSLGEGFGIPVLEAMAYGVPVVTSRGSALEEVAGECAILVNPEDAEDIAAGLHKLVQDAELRSKLEKAGRDRAELYSWERTVQSTYRVYEEALEEGK